jgi:fucose 4-O-acetylase-like acetyltransferase
MHSMIVKKNLKEKNIGIEILRIYLSILVVNTHCYKNINNFKYIKILINRLHVPTFFIISFYFFQNTLISRNLDKFKERFHRLLIPYIVWPIIFLIINNIINHFFNKKLKNTFRDLKKQILVGHCLNTVFWFQWNLIFETFLFIIVELSYHKYIIYILINIGLAAYFLQYSNYNYNLFSKFIYEDKFTFGRFAETIIYSISGFFFAYFKLIVFFQKNRIKTINICILIFMLIFHYHFIIEPKGFGYAGFELNILSSCLFIMFSMISNNIKIIYKIIVQISKFSPGIYYLHIPIKTYFENIFRVIRIGHLSGCIFIYIICYIICILGNLFFRKTRLINLFQ